MKILINISSLRNNHSGIARYIKNIVAEANKNNSELNFLFFDGKNCTREILIESNNSNRNYKYYLKKIIPFAYKLKYFVESYYLNKVIKEYRIDYYHEPNFISLKTNIPKIITVHDLAFLKYPETLPKDRLRWIKNNINQSIDDAYHIFTVSNTIKDELICHYNLNSSKVSVVENGINKNFLTYSDNDKNKVLEKYNLKNKRFFLYVGNVEPRKNIELLIDLYEKQKGDRLIKNTPLVIIGSDILNSNYGLKINHRITGSELNVLWLKGITDSELSEFYKASTSLLFPSLYEGFGIPIIESLFFGTPVIASKIDVFNELKELGVTLCDKNEKDVWYQSMQKNLSKPKIVIPREVILKKYSDKTISEKYLSILKKIL